MRISVDRKFDRHRGILGKGILIMMDSCVKRRWRGGCPTETVAEINKSRMALMIT